jgi:ribonucleoside-diphosphate reductase beta chain
MAAVHVTVGLDDSEVVKTTIEALHAANIPFALVHADTDDYLRSKAVTQSNLEDLLREREVYLRRVYKLCDQDQVVCIHSSLRELMARAAVDQKPEAMTAPWADRLSFMPIINEAVYDMQQKAQASYWIAKEVDLSHDILQYRTVLTDKERRLLDLALAFFSQADGLVMKNLALMFLSEVTMPEAFNFFAFQVAMESVHSEMYSRLIWAFVQDEQRRNYLLNAIETMPCVKRKAEWTKKWIDATLPFSHRVFAFTIVEGVFFSASFCVIFWFKDRGLMSGTTFSNTLISRDEGLHTDFGTLMYKMCKYNKLSQTEAETIIRDAVLCEEEFVNEAMPEGLLGINATAMIEYVRFCADRILVQTGHTAVFHSKNPFSFMDNISIDDYANFFEHKDANYQRAGVMCAEADNKALTFDEDF